MGAAIPWLPPGALSGESAARPVVAAVAAWSADWLGGGWRPAASFTRAAADDWTAVRQGDVADVIGRPKAVLDLAFALLGVRSRTDLTQADLRLLRRVAGDALDDLSDRVGHVCGDVRASDGPRWRLKVGPDERGPLAITLPEAALATIARRVFKPIARAVTLSSLRAAVAERSVDCTAWLGRAALSVEQFGALEPGDIILLDQPVGDTVPLAIGGRLSDLMVALGDGATLTQQD